MLFEAGIYTGMWQLSAQVLAWKSPSSWNSSDQCLTSVAIMSWVQWWGQRWVWRWVELVVY